MVDIRLPRQLTDKYEDLLRERAEIAARIEAVDDELSALQYALRLLDTEWEPPTRARKKQRRSRLAVGSLPRDCQLALKEHGELWTPELVALIAQRRNLRFEDRKAELSFASAVAMALRRYERQGFLETVGRHPTSGAFRWRIRRDGDSAAT